MSSEQKKTAVVSAQEFAKLDFKTSALTYNHKRFSIPLQNKPYVQLQGVAEPIRTFTTGTGGHSISFLPSPGDQLELFSDKVAALSAEIVDDEVLSRVKELITVPANCGVEHKTWMKIKDGIRRFTVFLHPTYTHYYSYDRDTKKKTALDFETMKQQPFGYYSLVVKVDHEDISFDEKKQNLVCGLVGYVEILMYIVPREKDKKNLKYAQEASQVSVEIDVSSFDSLDVPQAPSKKEENNKKRKVAE